MNEPDHPLRPETLLGHADFVRRLARKLIRDTHAAEDAAQGALVTAMEHPPGDGSNVRGWFTTVVRNSARQGHRGEVRREQRERSVARKEAVPSVTDVLEREAARTEVVTAVLALDEPTRDVILLRFYEDLPPRRIANQLGLPVETVRTRVKRGLEKLRRELDRRHGGERRVWTAALVPLLPRSSLIPTGGSPVMKIASLLTTKAAVVGVLVVGGGATVWYTTTDRSEGTSSAETIADAPVQAPADTFVPAGEGEAGEALAPARSPARVAARETTGARGARGVEIKTAAGRVVDHNGRGVPGAVIVAADRPRELEGMWEMVSNERWGDLRAEGFHTARADEEGRYELSFPADWTAAWAFVWREAPTYRLYPRQRRGLEFDLPATNIEFSAETVPTGRVHVRAKDRASGEALTGFGVLFHREGGEPEDAWARGEVATTSLALSEEGWAEYEVVIRDTRVSEASTTVQVRHGEDVEVEVPFDWGGEVTGLVVDAAGNPVADAVVWFGSKQDVRRRMYGPYSPESLDHAVRTATDGSFSMQGAGPVVSVWHAEHSPASVATADVERIALAPRGAIHGRVVDAAGQPQAGIRVRLDREQEATTDAGGAFRFEDCEAGVHGLGLPEERFVVVDVDPGEATDIEVGPGIIDITFEITKGGAPFTERIGGVLVGLDRVASLTEMGFRDGVGTWKPNLLPGRYVLIAERPVLAIGDVQSDRAVLEMGDADLTVTVSEPGTRVFLVPAGANDSVVHYAARITGKKAGEGGEVRFEPLPRGSYDVGVDPLGVVTTTEVTGPGARIDLRD